MEHWWGYTSLVLIAIRLSVFDRSRMRQSWSLNAAGTWQASKAYNFTQLLAGMLDGRRTFISRATFLVTFFPSMEHEGTNLNDIEIAQE